MYSVWPIYWPTSMLFSVRITRPDESIPHDANILPMIWATVVLPVPGLPMNTICMRGILVGKPFSMRRLTNLITFR